MAKASQFIPYKHPLDFDQDQSLKSIEQHFNFMNQRRSLREFSGRPVDQKIIEQIIMTASTAPSGAHKQPWTFCAIKSADIKKQIRAAAEKEEYESYHGRMPDTWLKDLEPFETDWNKPFLEIAPWLIIVFKKAYDLDEDGKKVNYYVNESVGIATGFLISAIHHAPCVAFSNQFIRRVVRLMGGIRKSLGYIGIGASHRLITTIN